MKGDIEYAQKLLEVLENSQQEVEQENKDISGVGTLIGRGYLLGIDVGINALRSIITYLQATADGRYETCESGTKSNDGREIFVAKNGGRN